MINHLFISDNYYFVFTMTFTTRYCANSASIPSYATDVIQLWHYRSTGHPDNWNNQTKLPFGFCYTVPTDIDDIPTRIIELDRDITGRLFPTSYHLGSRLEFMKYYNDEYSQEDIDQEDENELNQIKKDKELDEKEELEDYLLDIKFKLEKREEREKMMRFSSEYDDPNEVIETN
jgi:hypothetical protein